MASLPGPDTQNPPPMRSWRSRMSDAMVAAMLKKDSARASSSSSSQGSADPRNLSNATTTVDQERGRQMSKVPAEEYLSFDGPATPGEASPSAINNPMAGNGDIEYTNLTWWQCGMCMVAETISLGILSLPRALADLGLVAGLIPLLSMGALASYSGYIIGQFKLRYPDIHNMGHAGTKLFGKAGGHIIGLPTLAFIVFIMGAHILTFKLMMDVLTDNKYCGVIWTVVGLLVSFIACLPRTMKKMSYLSAASFASIIGAVIVTMVAIIKDHHDAERKVRHFQPGVHAWPKPGLAFHDYFNALTNIVFAYAGHVAFFAFISELRNPRDFNKSLAFLQISDVSMYTLTAVVLYYFAGDDIKSPALDSANKQFSKIAYAVASVTIIIAGVVNGHIAIKTTYVALNKRMGGQMMHQKSFKSRGIWVGITALLWIIAWILAVLIPVFNGFVGLTGALFASWFTFGAPAMFWMHMNLGGPKAWFNPAAYKRTLRTWNWKKYLALVANYLLFLVASVIFVAGTCASIRSIIASAKSAGGPFSCGHK